MVSKDLISVIIPVFNVRPYLEEALNSVICQTYTNLEIIIIDDGSTDGSGEICDIYARKDARIQVVHQVNQGLGNSRNAGLEIAKGEMIAFLDSDDAYQINFLSEMEAALRREKADIAVCKHMYCNTAGCLKKAASGKIEPSIAAGKYDRISALKAIADEEINYGVCNKLYRKELWKGIRFPEGRKFEDVITNLRIFDRCSSVFVIEKVLYLYRQRPESLSHAISKARVCDMIWAYSQSRSFIRGRWPEVFSVKNLNNNDRRWINALIIDYICYSGQSNDKEKNFDEWFKEQIISYGVDSDIHSLGIQTLTAYTMLRFCPRFLRAVYGACNPIRLQIKELADRKKNIG